MKTLSQCGGSSAGQSSGFLNRFFPYVGNSVARFFASFGVVSFGEKLARIAVFSSVLAGCVVGARADDVVVPASFVAKARACGGEICQIEDTKSMEPALNSRCLVIVRPAKFSEIRRDDIVVFSRNGKTFVHRAIDPKSGGWVTKGDNRPTRDVELLTRFDFIGIVSGIYEQKG